LSKNFDKRLAKIERKSNFVVDVQSGLSISNTGLNVRELCDCLINFSRLNLDEVKEEKKVE
jgi:hypothetical protein